MLYHYQHFGWNIFGTIICCLLYCEGNTFRADNSRGDLSKTLKMFFFSVSDVLCAISVMQPTWTVVLCCTPFPTLRHGCPREKSAHAWYRMVHDQYVSNTGDPYHKVLTHSLHVLFWSIFLFFKREKDKSECSFLCFCAKVILFTVCLVLIVKGE